MKYYFHDGHKQSEAHTLEELRASQKLKPDHHVWYEGLKDWKPASQFPELADLFQSPRNTPPPFKGKAESPIFAFADKAYRVLVIGGAFLFCYVCYFFVLPIMRQTETPSPVKTASITPSKEQQAKKQEEEEEELKKKNARENMNKLIRFEILSYQANEWIGGISNIRVRVYNNSDYPIESIKGRIGYIKSSGSLYGWGDVFASNIPPKSWVTVEAPDSDRGVKLQDCELLGVTCNAIGLDWGR